MRKLSIKEKTAVFISLAVVAFFFAFIGLFGFQLGGGTSQSGTVLDSVNTAQPDSDSSSFFVSDVVVGSGAEARPGQIITVHYTGTLTDGRVFDSSLNRGQPFSFVLGAGQVIKGWDRGVVGMKVGGTRVLTIPPELAYGANAIGGIPSNSTLIFNVELLSVENLQ
jgi:FKBP-type peptidyl-prolyl cis-trans isomerase